MGTRMEGVSPYKRFHALRLVLSVVLERDPPAVIALGPPSVKAEPLEWVMFMRASILEMGKWSGVPVLIFDTEDDVARALGAESAGRGSGLKTLLRKKLGHFASNERRVILATATSLAGALREKDRKAREKP